MPRFRAGRRETSLFAITKTVKERTDGIGGATLWVLQGHDDAEYQGVADFFSYLSSPEVQADWHQFSGYLPITQAACVMVSEVSCIASNLLLSRAVLKGGKGPEWEPKSAPDLVGFFEAAVA